MLRSLLCLAPLLPLALGKDTIQSRQDGGDEYGDIPANRYRRRAMQRVTALGDFIYILGGEISEYEDEALYYGAENPSKAINSTMVIPHGDSWDVPTLEFTYIDDGPQATNSFALWHDMQKNRLYRWGGSLSRGENISEDDVVLWELDADGNGGGSWDTSAPANADTFEDILATTGGGHTSCGRKGFWIGGVGRGATDSRLSELDTDEPLPLPGILTYDMDTRQWSNDSTAPMSQPSGTIINSAAACAQGFSLDPLIFSLGGAMTSPVNSEDDVSDIDMGNMTFWDPESKRWHWQIATGDVPSGRQSPCVAGARSTDGTYDIFMYGGLSSYGTRDDMYILSLPGFRWFSVDVESPTRMYHACATVGKRQMLSTGGVSREWDWQSQDPWVHAMGIFDMTALEWKDSYDANAADYESPQMVMDWYNNGGMDSVEWSDNAVKAMFVNKDGDTPGSDSGSSSGEKSSSTNTGAIAGGVVGGVAGIGVIGALIWFIRRRWRQNRAEKPFELGTPEPGVSHELTADRSDYEPSSATSNLKSPYPTPVEMATAGQERHELPDGQPRFELQG